MERVAAQGLDEEVIGIEVRKVGRMAASGPPDGARWEGASPFRVRWRRAIANDFFRETRHWTVECGFQI
jgi:hypothetical protein